MIAWLLLPLVLPPALMIAVLLLDTLDRRLSALRPPRHTRGALRARTSGRVPANEAPLRAA